MKKATLILAVCGIPLVGILAVGFFSYGAVSSVGVIGGADGPTTILVSPK